MSPSTRGPNDPGRRERIIGATLDVIAVHGVAGTTHRKVAQEAGVPLGSMTYYFSGLQDLLTAAFTTLVHDAEHRYAERLGRAGNTEEARQAVVDIISTPIWGSRRDLLLTYELYAYASRNHEVLEVVRSWTAATRVLLEEHFDARTARLVDAFLEGVIIHNSTEPEPMGRDDVESAVRALST